MPFAPTITGYPNKIGLTGKIYPEHLVLNQDLQDFEVTEKQSDRLRKTICFNIL